MTIQENLWLEGKSVVLDGNEYIGCTFRNCEIWYMGGKPPVFSDCTFVDCNPRLGDIPLNTIKFMASIKVAGMHDWLNGIIALIQRLNEFGDRPLH